MQTATRPNVMRQFRTALFGVLACYTSLTWPPVFAQESPAKPVSPATSQPKTGSTGQNGPASPTLNARRLKNSAEKIKAATFMLGAIVGIAIFGIGGIAATMIWATRLRRLARDMGPHQRTAGNDFWFLKPPKPNAADTDIASSHRPNHTPPDLGALE